MSDDKKNLFAEFPSVTTSEWDAKIIADLKGADYEKKLVWKTLEGFSVKPFYRAENLDSLTYLKQLPECSRLYEVNRSMAMNGIYARML